MFGLYYICFPLYFFTLKIISVFILKEIKLFLKKHQKFIGRDGTVQGVLSAHVWGLDLYSETFLKC